MKLNFLFSNIIFSLFFRTVFSSSDDIEVTLPNSITTLNEDLRIKIKSGFPLPQLRIDLSKLEGNSLQPIGNFSITPKPDEIFQNITFLTLPCGYFSRGGTYYIVVKPTSSETPITTQTINVKWQMPKLKVTPEHLQTYPRNPVVVTLEFPKVMCPPKVDSFGVTIPEFWFELHYCGHSPTTCDIFNSKFNETFQVLHSEQIRSYPGVRNITLKCEYFGLAGHYALFLRPTSSTPSVSYSRVLFLKVDWSEEFVFNVHAQSIFPCDRHNGGITVLFQYPACILLTGDRVRVFARRRAEVAALVPPTSLEYVSEQKVLRGSNKLKFDCDLFSERFIEYCFVYVSQAITGAVADVRMDCVPTLPVKESKSGGWGPWSEWTSCSSTCIGGTRSRYRLCDSPIPRFGGKFCDGQAVETEKCGSETGNIWECFDGNYEKINQKVDTSRIKDEVGLYCRCGCVVHLGRANPKRILATSSQSCPGRIFWQIQADKNCIIQFKIEWFDSPCGIQWLKIRDGMSLSSNLLADLSDVSGDKTVTINTTGNTMLLEFYSDEINMNEQVCGGGFLAYAKQIETKINESPLLIVHRTSTASPFTILKLTAVHSTSIFFLSGILIAMALLGAQYTFRYRKYHIAFTEDQDSIDQSASCPNLVERRASNSTLFSEVLSLHPLEHRILTAAEPQQTQNDGIEKENNKEKLKEKKSSVHSSTKESLKEETQNDLSSSSNINISDSSKEKSENDEASNKIKEKSEARNPPKPVKACFSTSRRAISTAAIKNTIPKEAKDKKNRERLLAGPSGSDFSISGTEVDLEIDYYDYNVRNAGAAPGSYLGMDPAFLVYIPPLYASGEISIEEQDEEEGLNMEEITNDKNGANPESIKDYCETEEVKEKESINVKEYNIIKDEISETYHDLQKTACKNLQQTSPDSLKGVKGKKIIEEISMIDSNILDEIKYADDDEEEKH